MTQGVRKVSGTLAAKVPFTRPVLAALIRRHLRLKRWLLVLIPLGLSIPFQALEAWPLFPVRIYPQIWLDRAIPFMPSAAWLYMSFFVYVAIAGLMVAKRVECWRFCWIMAGMGLIADAVFLIHPTAVPSRPAVSDQPYAFVVGHDQTGNACPSLHVAFTVFAAFVVHAWLSRFRARRSLRALSWVGALAISLSTIAIRQHLAIDFLWGTLLGVAGGIAWHWKSAPDREASV